MGAVAACGWSAGALPPGARCLGQVIGRCAYAGKRADRTWWHAHAAVTSIYALLLMQIGMNYGFSSVCRNEWMLLRRGSASMRWLSWESDWAVRLCGQASVMTLPGGMQMRQLHALQLRMYIGMYCCASACGRSAGALPPGTGCLEKVIGGKKEPSPSSAWHPRRWGLCWPPVPPYCN